MNSISGVYKIVNIVNKNKYIGSARNIEKRKREHFIALEKGCHHSLYLQRAFDLYGFENFVFEVIIFCDIDELIKNEQFYIDTCQPEYNMAKIAGSMLGYKHSEESKKKMSDSAKGRVFSEEFKNKMRVLFTGKKRPIDVTEKIKIANRNKVRTQEWNNNLSIAHIGKKHTAEQINKIRAAHIGRKNTPETIERMRQSAYKRIQRQTEQNDNND